MEGRPILGSPFSPVQQGSSVGVSMHTSHTQMLQEFLSAIIASSEPGLQVRASVRFVGIPGRSEDLDTSFLSNM